MSKTIIDIANDFSPTPGLRNRDSGPFSGEQFREERLEPLFKDGDPQEKIVINFDGGYGYAGSFLEEAFGGLVRTLKRNVVDSFEFISTEEPLLIERVKKYMDSAYRYVQGNKNISG